MSSDLLNGAGAHGQSPNSITAISNILKGKSADPASSHFARCLRRDQCADSRITASKRIPT